MKVTFKYLYLWTFLLTMSVIPLDQSFGGKGDYFYLEFIDHYKNTEANITSYEPINRFVKFHTKAPSEPMSAEDIRQFYEDYFSEKSIFPSSTAINTFLNGRVKEDLTHLLQNDLSYRKMIKEIPMCKSFISEEQWLIAIIERYSYSLISSKENAFIEKS